MNATKSFLLGLQLILFLLLPFLSGYSGAAPSKSKGIQVINKPAEHRVDVTVDGAPFTSYIFPETLKKPVLFPIQSAEGHMVTRGFPLEPRPGERVDHPHHVGFWFNHGDVNGFDFWNNSNAIATGEKNKMGTILHKKVIQAVGGKQQGLLEVAADWIQGDGKLVLKENTTFVFRATPHARIIDRITKLTAFQEKVTFKDNKEGVLGIRVCRALEQPSKNPEVYTDSSGRPMSVPTLDNTGVTGLYRNSDGLTGDAVWSSRAPWTMLSGVVEGEKVTVAILDQPQNPGYPTYWHARGYGLFAANMLGEKVFTNGKKEFNFAIEPGKTALFHYRIIIFSGETTPEQVRTQQELFAAELKKGGH
jgi:hypothetical protein